MSISLKQHPLFQKLDSLNIPKNDYVIMGSGIMFALGIRELERLDDIDILVTQKGWDITKGLSTTLYDDEWDCEYLYLFDEQIEIWEGWGPGQYISEELIKSSITIDGYNFCNIDEVVRWKKEVGREKDIKHIHMIENYLKQTQL
jgi:predicted nucleotidyltransferase